MKIKIPMCTSCGACSNFKSPEKNEASGGASCQGRTRQTGDGKEDSGLEGHLAGSSEQNGRPAIDTETNTSRSGSSHQ